MIKLGSLIQESSSDNLIVVDVQPEYEKNINFNLYKFFEFLLHSNYKKVYYLYNGRDTLGMCSEEELKDWMFQSYDYDEKYFDILNTFNFYDKGYAYFRYCMDSNIDDSDIITLVKFMYKHNIRDSRDFEERDWDRFIEFHGKNNIRELLEFSDDMVNIPDLMDYLTQITGKIFVVGGGVNECLREVVIALKSLNKTPNFINKWIY